MQESALWRVRAVVDSIPANSSFGWYHQSNAIQSPGVFMTGDGLMAIGLNPGDPLPEHPLDIRSSTVGSGNADIVIGLISDNTDRPTIQFSSGSTAIPENGMSIEYNGRASVPKIAINSKSSSPSELFRFDNNGDAWKSGGGSWSSLSDRRLKSNIEDYGKGLSEVLTIRPVTYHYTAESGLSTEPEHVGVIAQELQQVAPSMVSTFTTNDGEYLSVNDSEMTYMLINAVKELAEKSERQDQLIEELLQQNEELERRLSQLSDKS